MQNRPNNGYPATSPGGYGQPPTYGGHSGGYGQPPQPGYAYGQAHSYGHPASPSQPADSGALPGAVNDHPYGQNQARAEADQHQLQQQQSVQHSPPPPPAAYPPHPSASDYPPTGQVAVGAIEMQRQYPSKPAFIMTGPNGVDVAMTLPYNQISYWLTFICVGLGAVAVASGAISGNAVGIVLGVVSIALGFVNSYFCVRHYVEFDRNHGVVRDITNRLIQQPFEPTIVLEVPFQEMKGVGYTGSIGSQLAEQLFIDTQHGPIGVAMRSYATQQQLEADFWPLRAYIAELRGVDTMRLVIIGALQLAATTAP